MKLGAKIALAMVALLGVLFAVGGTVMVGQNHTRSLNGAVAQGASLHQAQKDYLRAALVGTQLDGGTLEAYDIKLLGGQAADLGKNAGGVCALLDESHTALFNNLPGGFNKGVQQALMEAERPGTLFYRFEGSTYVAFASPVTAAARALWLISAFDISPVFGERQQQMNTFYIVYAALLVCAAALAGLLAALATRPIRHLSRASRQIAQGNYGLRTGIVRDDEIGLLAQSFDGMAAAIEEKVERLELSVRQREDFMAAFTHELKTPMTAMMGYATLLKQDAMPPAERGKALDYIHSETRRLEDLSQKLLMLLGLAEEAVEPAPVMLDEVFAGVAHALPAQAANRVAFRPAPDACVLADADLLGDLLLNLIQNGLNAGGEVEVALDDAGEDGFTIQVRDTGCGMPPEVLRRITEPFYRPDKARARKGSGSGLGLAIAARIAALHATRLQFESGENTGTTVSFTLGRCAGEGADAPC